VGGEQTRQYFAMPEPERDPRNANLAELLASLARGQRLLDLGCGYGVHLDAARRAGLSATGVEADPRLVALAKQRFGDLDVRCDRIESFDTDERFDTVLLVDVLEMIEDDAAALARAARLLAPGGRLVLCVPHGPGYYGARDRRFGFYRRYDRTETIARLESLGLRVVMARHWNAIAVLPYVLVHRVLGLRGEAASLRGGAPRGRFLALASRLLDAWYRRVESRLDFGFGLSLVVVAERPA
jgi:SAM-dependent methyltransferase